MRVSLWGNLSPLMSVLGLIALTSACGDDDDGGGAKGGAGGAMAGKGGSGGAGRGGSAGSMGSGGSSGSAGRGGTAGTSGTGGTAGSSGSAGSAGTAGTAGMPGDAGSDASAPGDTYAVTSANRLLFINRASGSVASVVNITGIPATEAIVGMDFRPADSGLYVVTTVGKIYVVDKGTGAATLKSTLTADPADTSAPFTALAGNDFGVDFNPVPDRLRIVSNTGQNLRINVDTGATITDGALNPGSPQVGAAAYTNSFAAACRTRLYVIDAVTKKLLIQDPPNDGRLTEVGDLGSGASLGTASGFEIASQNDGTMVAVAAFTALDGTRLYDIDPTTGAATNARTLSLNSGETLRGLSIAPPAAPPAQAFGELLGVTVSNKLVSFNRAAPGKLCTSASITGLQANENVLGIDVRPADGALYALASTGRLYTVNSGGAATLKSTLTADAADTTDAFTALAGADFGVGFNPVPDRLRVTSNTGQNLRINVDTGATTTDAALSPSTPSVTAVGYSNSFPGAKSTTLFALDTGTDSLVRVGADPATGGACPGDAGNPNCGVVASIGALGIGDVTGVDGFDLDGRTGAAGNALAAVAVGAATASSLYAIDLSTGAAAPPAGVANPTIGGGERLRGLALAANPSLAVFGLTANGRLVSFVPATPGTLTTDVAISGLGTGESLVGIDFRPADGRLYAIGSSGKLYSVNTASGAVTLVASLSAAAGDDNPFTALSATAAFGQDFNPVPDLLRLVDNAGSNLRIVPSARSLGTPAVAQVAGATFTDAALNPATPALVAVAYTNSYASSTVTTLLGVDGTADALVRVGGPDGTPSPNTGTVTAVGALGIDVTGDAGFDIAGGRNGIAIVAARTSGASSELFAINLATGAASPFNTAAGANNVIGTSGTTQPLKGLAIELK
jgi:hypothetical protein